MKQLELTETKATQLNAICQFAVNKGILNTFDLFHYQKNNPEFDIHYYRHLLDIARQYENINNLIDISSNSICATHNTSEFLKSGGFLRLLKIEMREDNIQDFTLKNLKQNVLGTKEWFTVLIVTVCVAIATTLLTDKLSEKNSRPDTNQVQTQLQSSSSKTYQDSLSSYNDGLKIKK